MSDELAVEIEGITLRGRCGVTPEERALGQTLVIDLRLVPETAEACETDELDDAVNYGAVVELVRRTVEGREFHLLERLARVLIDEIWDAFPLASLEVAVAKQAPPVSLPTEVARVELVREA
jgi:7,8-dihydroneopterin aldolase/epimerase/oxygenase